VYIYIYKVYYIITIAKLPVNEILLLIRRKIITHNAYR
jgi:hypothetical protein